MADLAEEVQRRYGPSLLIELTNQDQQGGRLLGEDVLQAAAEDTKAQFKTEAGVSYDGENKEHVGICVIGCMYYLHLFAGLQTDAMGRWKELWERRLDFASQRLGERRRLLPVTSSTLQQSTQPVGVRPDFDRASLDPVTPKLPGASASVPQAD